MISAQTAIRAESIRPLAGIVNRSTVHERRAVVIMKQTKIPVFVVDSDGNLKDCYLRDENPVESPKTPMGHTEGAAVDDSPDVPASAQSPH
jgi:hypothetical protein